MNSVTKHDSDRLKLFKKCGYDIPKARNYVIAKARLKKGGSILEVGTGRGHMTTELARKGFELTSIDLNKKAQSIAKMHIKAIERDKLVTFKIMNAERLRYKVGSFDQVISVNFIHHAKDPIKCLKEMIRVMRNKLVIADINKEGERIMKKVHKIDGHDHPNSKISFKDMKIFLEKAGMKTSLYRDACQNILIGERED